MDETNLDREVKVGLVDGLVLALAAPALILNFAPVLIPLAIAHIALGLVLTSSKGKWLASSAAIWGVAGFAVYGLWVFGWNPPAGASAGPDWTTIACQAVLLPAIMLALFAAPGERSMVAQYMRKFGALEP